MVSVSAISSSEAELLAALEFSPALEALGRALGRDPTVVSKQLKRIAERTDFVRKTRGRWALSDAGKAFNRIHADYLFAQGALRRQKRNLRIGTNREFASRVVAPHFAELRRLFPETALALYARDGAIEESLLAGEIDLALECGKPWSPEVNFRQAVDEPIVAVAAPAIARDFIAKKFAHSAERTPYVACDRLSFERLSGGALAAGVIAARTDDVATARALCVAGVGWALLPRYAVRAELKRGALLELGAPKYRERYGVWALRSRVALRESRDRLQTWLVSRKLN
ncbi:MAG: substrate-binding domain-containing protein [Bdellovibrionales bacterium]|nr:substrate-binding domain-containing protein [Bdellovibrionales bacterium]